MAYTRESFVKTQRHYRYLYVRRPDHPNATASGYIAEHRLIAATSLGRTLRAGEVVHHRNGDTLDNRPENLQVLQLGAHTRIHRPRKRVTITCFTCGNDFQRKAGEATRRKTAASKQYCSRACAGISDQPRQTLTCPCGRCFVLPWAKAMRSKGFCSHRCAQLFSPSGVNPASRLRTAS